MQVVGLSGFARAGKDEVAKILVRDYGFTQVAFADKLREMIYALNPIVSYTRYVRTSNDTFGVVDWEVEVYLQEAIDDFGWSGYKETPYGPEIRRLLQRLGTEAGRQTLWDSIWIDAALDTHPEDARLVVSDARFINEFDAIKQRGGQIWRVERPGVGPQSDHLSETEALTYKGFSATIQNNGTLDDLAIKVKRIYDTQSGF